MSEGNGKRRWFRFSLATMFVVVTFVSIAARSWIELERREIASVNRRIQARAQILKSGGWVWETGEAMHVWSDWQMKLHVRMGDYEVVSLGLPQGAPAAEFEKLGALFPEAGVWEGTIERGRWVRRTQTGPHFIRSRALSS